MRVVVLIVVMFLHINAASPQPDGRQRAHQILQNLRLQAARYAQTHGSGGEESGVVLVQKGKEGMRVNGMGEGVGGGGSLLSDAVMDDVGEYTMAEEDELLHGENPMPDPPRSHLPASNVLQPILARGSYGIHDTRLLTWREQILEKEDPTWADNVITPTVPSIDLQVESLPFVIVEMDVKPEFDTLLVKLELTKRGMAYCVANVVNDSLPETMSVKKSNWTSETIREKGTPSTEEAGPSNNRKIQVILEHKNPKELRYLVICVGFTGQGQPTEKLVSRISEKLKSTEDDATRAARLSAADSKAPPEPELEEPPEPEPDTTQKQTETQRPGIGPEQPSPSEHSDNESDTHYELSPFQIMMMKAKKNAEERLLQRNVLRKWFKKAPTQFPVGFAEGYSQAYRMGYEDFMRWRSEHPEPIDYEVKLPTNMEKLPQPTPQPQQNKTENHTEPWEKKEEPVSTEPSSEGIKPPLDNQPTSTGGAGTSGTGTTTNSGGSGSGENGSANQPPPSSPTESPREVSMGGGGGGENNRDNSGNADRGREESFF
eukprot:c8059_g1_i1.p1 GENE.c8059_g1_i1~~c8059_g1_i1.p1  ORF type:complete len:544 (+),score=172.35 c8059_g1_i1:50-1681(+)